MSESWHLRKELSVGTILSLLVLGSGSIAAFTSIQNDVEQLQQEPKVEIADVARIEERQRTLQEDVKDIKQKVERLPAIEEAIKNLADQIERERQRNGQ